MDTNFRSALFYACRGRNQICDLELLHQEPECTGNGPWWKVGAAAKG